MRAQHVRHQQKIALRRQLVSRGDATLHHVAVAIGLRRGQAMDRRCVIAVCRERHARRYRETVQCDGIAGAQIIHAIGDRRVRRQRVDLGARLVQAEMRHRHRQLVAPDRQRTTQRRGPVGVALPRLVRIAQVVDSEITAQAVARPVGAHQQRRMRADQPASAPAAAAAEHVVVVAEPLLQLRIQQETVGTNARRIEVRPGTRGHGDTWRRAIAGNARRKIHRQQLRSHTAIHSDAADHAARRQTPDPPPHRHGTPP